MGWFDRLKGWLGSSSATSSPPPPPTPLPPPPGQPTGVGDVIARLTAVGASLPVSDGVAVFNQMYLTVTEQVRDRLAASWFHDPAFLDRLDAVFAGLYLQAVDAATRGEVVPEAWAPLVAERGAPDRQPVQFALAGMNAHINHDLPVAVVTTCQQLGRTPGSPGVSEDYQKVTTILEAIEQQVRESFLSGPALAADRSLAPVVTAVCNWSMARARDAAWANAMVLWELQRLPAVRDDFLATLAGTVNLASRSLLIGPLA